MGKEECQSRLREHREKEAVRETYLQAWSRRWMGLLPPELIKPDLLARGLTDALSKNPSWLELKYKENLLPKIIQAAISHPNFHVVEGVKFQRLTLGDIGKVLARKDFPEWVGGGIIEHQRKFYGLTEEEIEQTKALAEQQVGWWQQELEPYLAEQKESQKEREDRERTVENWFRVLRKFSPGTWFMP